MIESPEIVQTEARPAATVRLTVSRGEVAKVMDAAIQEVLRALAAQHIPPAGPLFAHHARIEPEVFVFDVGFPVRTAITPVGRVENTAVPAARAADSRRATWVRRVAASVSPACRHPSRPAVSTRTTVGRERRP